MRTEFENVSDWLYDALTPQCIHLDAEQVVNEMRAAKDGDVSFTGSASAMQTMILVNFLSQVEGGAVTTQQQVNQQNAADMQRYAVFLSRSAIAVTTLANEVQRLSAANADVAAAAFDHLQQQYVLHGEVHI